MSAFLHPRAFYCDCATVSSQPLTHLRTCVESSRVLTQINNSIGTPHTPHSPPPPLRKPTSPEASHASNSIKQPCNANQQHFGGIPAVLSLRPKVYSFTTAKGKQAQCFTGANSFNEWKRRCNNVLDQLTKVHKCNY